jgi:hypothetical protein
MRRAILGITVTLIGAACNFAPSPGTEDPVPLDRIVIQQSPSPFSQITAGSVRALIPDAWSPFPATDGPREGFFAAPRPERWIGMDGTREGMAATWVDATEVGVPSDFYYLAATGPLLSGLLGSPACEAERSRVFADNRPGIVSGDPTSPGDYVARAEGTCRVGERVNRWAFFVAAPGFGPTRTLGIPRSGLYLVVAVIRDGRRADTTLHRLISRTRFGDALVGDFVEAVSDRRP